jgi:hypothetical protein
MRRVPLVGLYAAAASLLGCITLSRNFNAGLSCDPPGQFRSQECAKDSQKGGPFALRPQSRSGGWTL